MTTTLKHVSIILAALSLSLSAAAQLPGEDEIVVPDYSAYILTPKAPDTPRINGPKVYGAPQGGFPVPNPYYRSTAYALQRQGLAPRSQARCR